MPSISQRKISKEAGILLSVHGLSSVIRNFSKVFLGIYFLKLTEWNIGLVAMFYAVFYFTNAVFFILIGDKIKCRDKLVYYRIGILFYFIFLLLITLLNEDAGKYIFYLAVIFGIADGFYWLPYNVLKFELNSYSDRTLFFGYEKGMDDFVRTTIPAAGGVMIALFNSYIPIIIAVMIFAGLAYLASFRVRGVPPRMSLNKINIRAFLKQARRNEGSDIIRSYRGEFLRGINYIGALEVVVPVLIYLSFQSEFTLGVLTSLFAGISIITSLAVGKFLKESYFNIILILSGILLFFGTMLLVFNVSSLSVILYNVLIALAVPILNILQTVYSYNSVEKEELVEYSVEHLIIREVSRNAGRILGFAILFASGLFGSSIAAIQTVLVILSFSILLIPLSARRFRMYDA